MDLLEAFRIRIGKDLEGSLCPVLSPYGCESWHPEKLIAGPRLHSELLLEPRLEPRAISIPPCGRTLRGSYEYLVGILSFLLRQVIFEAMILMK